MRRTSRLLAALLATACLPATAHAAPSVTLHVALTPEHLGRGTTLSFRLHLATPPGQLPIPITELNLDYPSSLGLSVGGLGVLSCPLVSLEENGPRGCSTNARMGQGHATAIVPLGPEPIVETAEITVFRAPEQQNHPSIYFFLDAETPVNDEIVIPGLVMRTAAPAQEALRISVPLLHTVPDGPYAALTQLDASIGPNNLSYHERTHGHLITYKPAGVLLPDHCPHNGFQFSAHLTFLTNTQATANARVPCP